MLKLAEGLIGKKCAKSLLVDLEYKNVPCLRLAVSKALGLGIIAGSALVKLPQIFKLLQSGSTEGMSFLASLLETLSGSINFAYNYRAGNPFTMYGETLFVTLQNLAIVGLLGVYRRQGMQLALLVGVYAILMSCLIYPDLYPIDGVWLNYLQVATIPISAASRLPQIMKIWSTGRTGQLSIITVFMTALGSIARLFTTLNEAGHDQLLLVGYGTSALLNAIIALQMVWYWRSSSANKVKGPAKKKRS